MKSQIESLWGGIRIKPGPFPLGTDSVLLSDFITLRPQARVADLGAGCGTLGLLLSARSPSCRITGIELDDTAYAMGLENLALNPGAGLTLLQGDVRNIPQFLPAGSFDCVISNPPYFPVGSGKAANAYRSELTLTLKELCRAAAWLLPSGGTFALVHRPERLCDLFWEMRSHGMEPKKLRFVRHKRESPVCLVLIEGRRGGKPGLTYLPDLIEFHSDGSETEDYRAAYHRGESL